MDFGIFFSADAQGGIPLRVVNIGKLNLPSGELVGLDPFFVSSASPFIHKILADSYPVELCLAFPQPDNPKTAFARIKISDKPTIKWTRAWIAPPAIDARDVVSEKGFGGDSGLACYSDIQSARFFHQKVKAYYKFHPFGNYYDDILAPEFLDSAVFPKSQGEWCNHFPDKERTENLIMFSTPWKEGFYYSWWGLDVDGYATSLVTDFNLFELEE